MQTFLPFDNFSESAKVLDNSRIWKQVLEARQIVAAIELWKMGRTSGWANHPITKMWRPYLDNLKVYHNIFLEEALNRGFDAEDRFFPSPQVSYLPVWFRFPLFHQSHMGNLIRKLPGYYTPIFSSHGVNEPMDRYAWLDPDTGEWYYQTVGGGKKSRVPINSPLWDVEHRQKWISDYNDLKKSLSLS